MQYQDHTTARALTDRYRTTRPASRKARRNRPPVMSVSRRPTGHPVPGPVTAS